MDFKKALIVTLGGTAIGAGFGGIKGLGKGLDVGAKIGFLAGVKVGILGSIIFVVGKKKIKEKRANCRLLNVEE